MKAITLLVVLALVALASATSSGTVSSTYAWWFNFVQATAGMSVWMSCLFGGALSVFFANDAGTQFY